MPYVAIGEMNLYYEESGNGVPVLLAHGGFSDISEWSPQVPAQLKYHYQASSTCCHKYVSATASAARQFKIDGRWRAKIHHFGSHMFIFEQFVLEDVERKIVRTTCKRSVQHPRKHSPKVFKNGETI